MHYFDEMKQYVGFDGEDAARLAKLLPIVEPHFDAVVEAFYQALQANPRTLESFEGPHQVDRLRGLLRMWLLRVFSGPYDAHYYAERRRIGMAHVQFGLLPQFMFGAMNVIRSALRDAVLESDVDDVALSLRSVDRILDVELAVMLGSYWDRMMQLKLQGPAAMASGLAHEIRNPLNAMELHLTLLERRTQRGADPDYVAAFVESMRSEIRRLLSLTTEMMDFAKPVEISPAWHDARTFIAGLRKIHGPVLDVSSIRLEAEVCGPTDIYCDRDRLTQVFTNLLANSAEAMDGGQISIGIDNTGSGTHISFADDGAGLPPGVAFQIFDLFFTTKPQGTGLGLPIVKKIVEAHGGTVAINGRRGIGTTVSIYLPRPTPGD